jgi:beta-lactamase regulating signal transducer with metallopeptidase domain
VVGWLRPVVLAPVGALAGLPAEQMEALLLHELAHIRRYDYLVNMLQSAVEALLFYHPAVWWVSGHMRAERELCCDDAAVSASGDALVYARALAELASFCPPVVMAANGGSLAHRIGRLLGQPRSAPRTLSGTGIVAAAVLPVIAALA